MNIDFVPSVVVWMALALTAIVPIFRYKVIASREDAHRDLLDMHQSWQQMLRAGL